MTSMPPNVPPPGFPGDPTPNPGGPIPGGPVPPHAPAFVMPNAVHQLPWIGFNFSNAWSQGIAVFKAQYGLLMAGVGIAFGVQMAQSVIGQVLTLVGQVIDPTVGIVVNLLFTLIITVLVSWPMQASVQYVGVAARRGEQITMKVLFRGFYRLGTVALAAFLTALIYIGCMLPCMLVIVPMIIMGRSGQIAAEVAVAIGAVAAVINGVGAGYMASRLCLTSIMCLDERIGQLTAVEAIKTSWEWTRNRGWLVFGVLLTAGLAVAASVLLLCVGYLLVGMPLMIAIIGVAYHQLGFEQGIFPTQHVCPVCSYDLRGMNAVTCPECGANVTGYTGQTHAAEGDMYGAPPTMPGSP